MKERAGRLQRVTTFLAFSMIILLVAEFITGTITNLFVEFPANVTGWTVMRDSGALLLHLVLGILLALVALGDAVVSIIRRKGWPIAVSAVGVLGILFAMLNGFYFLNSQVDSASFSMASGLALAILAYSIRIYIETFAAAESRT